VPTGGRSARAAETALRCETRLRPNAKPAPGHKQTNWQVGISTGTKRRYDHPQRRRSVDIMLKQLIKPLPVRRDEQIKALMIGNSD
jgi:hypothetical protein